MTIKAGNIGSNAVTETNKRSMIEAGKEVGLSPPFKMSDMVGKSVGAVVTFGVYSEFFKGWVGQKIDGLKYPVIGSPARSFKMSGLEVIGIGLIGFFAAGCIAIRGRIPETGKIIATINDQTINFLYNKAANISKRDMFWLAEDQNKLKSICDSHVGKQVKFNIKYIP
ncbi:hypothetical protein [Photorhabdus asymbiotica]|uniref:hypothetical protein n=1 Tax=Photorhabdus asymbiotica TaxID=291112 RepID=UPI003DA6D6C6